VTRQDRAALTLALEVLRAERRVRNRHRGLEATLVLDAAASALRVALPVLGEASQSWKVYVALRAAWWHVEERLCRARLALYLRAVLRADAGEWPKETFLRCGRCMRDHGSPESSQMVCSPYPRRAGVEHCPGLLYVEWRRRGRITPWWESVPAHDGRTPRERREAAA
jgi:hypothetical protein